jgi:hypothetical protein
MGLLKMRLLLLLLLKWLLLVGVLLLLGLVQHHCDPHGRVVF